MTDYVLRTKGKGRQSEIRDYRIRFSLIIAPIAFDTNARELFKNPKGRFVI